jgi:hypothetical protein
MGEALGLARNGFSDAGSMMTRGYFWWFAMCYKLAFAPDKISKSRCILGYSENIFIEKD